MKVHAPKIYKENITTQLVLLVEGRGQLGSLKKLESPQNFIFVEIDII